MTEILHRPGFLGTAGNFATDMTLVISLLVAAALTVGVVLARRREFRSHRVVQTAAASSNAVLVLWMMVFPFFDFVAPGIPERLGEPFYWVTALHATVGAAALLLGVFVVLRANGLMPQRLRFRNYKGFMRVSYALYMMATLIGVAVYFSWFVWNPNPPTFS